MSKRPLPLDSPNWTPLTEVHRFVCGQTGDRRLADQDLTDAMANGRVRSMRRQVERLHDDEPDRELLPPSFWATVPIKLLPVRWSLVVERATAAAAIAYSPQAGAAGLWTAASTAFAHYVFYAWKPDWKKILVCVPRWRTQGMSARKARKTRASSDHPEARTARGNRASLLAKGRFIAPESETTLITELRAWHK